MATYAELLKARKASGQVKRQSVKFHQFEKKGESILGKLMGISALNSTNGQGTYNMYLFETDDGFLKCSLGAAADQDMAPLWQLGGVYYVEYAGKEKLPNNRSMHRFEIDLVMEADGDHAPMIFDTTPQDDEATE